LPIGTAAVTALRNGNVGESLDTEVRDRNHTVTSTAEPGVSTQPLPETIPVGEISDSVRQVVGEGLGRGRGQGEVDSYGTARNPSPSSVPVRNVEERVGTAPMLRSRGEFRQRQLHDPANETLERQYQSLRKMLKKSQTTRVGKTGSSSEVSTAPVGVTDRTQVVTEFTDMLGSQGLAGSDEKI